jgi:hypothetical protein
MKRLFAITAIGIALAGLTYFSVYYIGTAKQRQLQNQENPELAWLKTEFGLTVDEYTRIRELHYAYLPECDEMCALVSEKNELLKKLMGDDDATEVRARVLKETLSIRASCQEMMLNHFYKVSREMRPEARKRYLDWVLTKTVTPSHARLEETIRHHP